jgi:hypothetical protein
MNIPVAYAADTPRNRNILAIGIYTNPFTINGLITPSGSIPTREIQVEIEKLSIKLGIQKPIRSGQASGVYGNTYPGKNVPIEKPAVTPETPVEKKFNTVEACLAEAEQTVFERFAPFVVKMKEEHKNQWRNTREYRDTFVPAIDLAYRRLLKDNGIKEPVVAETAQT